MSDYQETIDYLYSQTPQFQQIGAAAYKPGLDTVRSLASLFGNPQQRLKCIHVAGTNGKGSTAHSIAAVLQSAGYKTGLFTSPHLLDFRERIKINGRMIPREDVTGFVDRFRRLNLQGLEPSFFELTTVMAFDWFVRNNVDFAVIEVGLGGRLDSTNIITPILSVITNISFDHTAQLGDTLESIAREKAGIIKPGVPVVVGEAYGEVRKVFCRKAGECGAPLVLACEVNHAGEIEDAGAFLKASATPFGSLEYELTGLCQKRNLDTILAALSELRHSGVEFDDRSVKNGLGSLVKLTGLAGRWMKVAEDPVVICDTGHNIGGWEYLSRQLDSRRGPLFMVIGFVNDKDISHILPLMPARGKYFFTQASVPRALPAGELALRGAENGLVGDVYPTVAEAVCMARRMATEAEKHCVAGESPLIFVGGSTFVVADLLAMGDVSTG